VFDQLLAEPRVIDPPRVIYRVNPAFELEDAGTGLRVRHTSAYWVSDLQLRDPQDRNPTVEGQEVDHSRNAAIDVTSLARPERTVAAVPVTSVGENYSAGADFCGPNPAVKTDDTWRMKGLDLVDGPAPRSNGMTIDIARFSAATLDLSRMGIDVTKPITVAVDGDGPATFALDGPWADGTRVTVSRAASIGGVVLPATSSWTVTAQGGRVLLADDFAGSNAYALTPHP
jgi:hypothetical protein